MEAAKIRRRQSRFHVTVSKALRPVARPRAAEAQFHEFDKCNCSSWLSLAIHSHPSVVLRTFLWCHIAPPETLMLKLAYLAQLSRFLKILILIC